MTGAALLIGQIRQNLTDLERLVHQTTLLQKVQATGDEDYWEAITTKNQHQSNAPMLVQSNAFS